MLSSVTIHRSCLPTLTTTSDSRIILFYAIAHDYEMRTTTVDFRVTCASIHHLYLDRMSDLEIEWSYTKDRYHHPFPFLISKICITHSNSLIDYLLARKTNGMENVTTELHV